jgi:hemerythrin
MLEWLDEYSVGNAELDSQHKSLFQKINTISMLAKSSDYDPEKSAALLNDFLEYAQLHFSAEERLMEQNGFSDLEMHRDSHSLYVATMTELLLESIHGTDKIKETCEFLKRWWLQHILGEDQLYSPLFDS